MPIKSLSGKSCATRSSSAPSAHPSSTILPGFRNNLISAYLRSTASAIARV